MKDWKTSTAGVLTILVGLITFIALPYLQGHPPNLTGFIGSITAGGGLIAASDSGKAAQ